ILDAALRIAGRLDATAQGLPEGPAFERMSRDLASTLASLRQFSQSLDSPASRAKLEASLDNLNTATAAMASIARKVDHGEGMLGALINDTALYDDVRTLLGRANRSKALRFIVRQAMKPEDRLEGDEDRSPPTQIGH